MDAWLCFSWHLRSVEVNAWWPDPEVNFENQDCSYLSHAVARCYHTLRKQSNAGLNERGWLAWYKGDSDFYLQEFLFPEVVQGLSYIGIHICWDIFPVSKLVPRRGKNLSCPVDGNFLTENIWRQLVLFHCLSGKAQVCPWLLLWSQVFVGPIW